MLHWLEAIIQQRLPSSLDKPLLRIQQHKGWLGFLQTRETDTRDSFGLKTFEVASARIQHSQRNVLQGVTTSWLPNHAIAQEWLSFVQQPKHPILPLH